MTIRIWLKQHLCSHSNLKPISWGKGDITFLCKKCNLRIIKPNYCKHPFQNYQVVTTTFVKGLSGSEIEVPDTWKCGDCGFPFLREEKCPNCSHSIQQNMNITGHQGLFSCSFYCSQCGVYFNREELHGVFNVIR